MKSQMKMKTKLNWTEKKFQVQAVIKDSWLSKEELTPESSDYVPESI